MPGRVLSPADIVFAFPPWAAPDAGRPANDTLSDVALQLHPWLIWAASEIRGGHFPLWNPHAFTGAPFFASAPSALLSPLTALAYVLPIETSLTLIPVARFWLAGLAMYWCLRVLALRVFAAFIGALAFMFSAPAVVWAQYPIATALATFPLLLGLAERVRTRGDDRTVAALAIAVAFAVTAGYPQVAALALLTSAAWILARRPGAPGGLRALARYAAGVALGLALAAVQVLPFLEYVAESAVLEYRTQWFPVFQLPGRAAVTFFLPFYYGTPTGHDFWGPWSLSESAVSIGLVPWVALPLALAAWRRRDTRVLAALAVAAAALLYGAPGAEAIATLPGMSLIVGFRTSILLVFALCALGAIGVDSLGRGVAPRWASAALAAMFTAIVVATFLSVVDDYPTALRVGVKIPITLQYLGFLAVLTMAAVSMLVGLATTERWPGVALVAAQLASTLPLAGTYNPVLEAASLYPTTPSIEHLKRATARDPGRVLLLPNVSMLYGLSEVGGYDGMTPRRVARLVRPYGSTALLGHGTVAREDVLVSAAFDLLGVKWIVSSPGAPPPRPGLRLDYDGPDARIYVNARAFPRAFFAHRARCVDDDAALRLISTGAVDLRQEVLLSSCPDVTAPGPVGSAAVEIVGLETERVRLRVDSETAGFVVLTDSWFPGWRATLDGREQPLQRANYALRAVWVPAGKHDVELRYAPRSVMVGLGVSLAAAIALAALWWGRARPERIVTGAGWIAIAAALATVIVTTAAVGPTLPRSPFDFRVSPPTIRQGRSSTIEIRPAVSRASTGRDEVDLYLVRLARWDAFEFLTPDGHWVGRPAPYRAGVAIAAAAPISAPWRWEPRAGSGLIILIGARPGGDPRRREDWSFQPTVRVLAFRAALTPDLGPERVRRTLGGLGLAAAGACAMVTTVAWRRRTAA